MAFVYLYEHSNYEGRWMEIPAGGASFQPINRQEFGVSSIKIPSGFVVELSNSQGSELYKESTPYVGDAMNDRVEGIAITQIYT
ncbi:hypothetical protein ACN23B_30565 (plasmid) [Anabaena sp. FACHB-709]|uniref:Uncharacterized protein n=3 Tax=Nostocaceae TaxID=1162 RepID=A0A1Z4KX60_ANAVA|nr:MULTISPECIES: hypothetical protein [Nostocaceae]BAY73537.1 hypothetical protein NIES23_63890 [Trichormus variabilis NIES-23]MBD2174601.1 hypothetical protein [Anabaena cylindrica FACHB-318]MBD2266348.1 hypothetical protein [Anabaena sp. FACHB-709]MBD2275774.1 hypothetical protein [Nostoc sp. PCC 7120 = FACHB-418]MBD2286978.1 hypothetical protein [Anabaena cylindrica FACHB-170]